MERIMSLALLLAVAGAAGAQEHADPLVVRGGDVLVAPGQILENTSILVEQGRITKVGRGISVPEGTHVLEAGGSLVAPAFLDARNQGLLDPATAEAEKAGPEGWAADALRACDPRPARKLLAAGVGLTYQGAPAESGTGLAGCLVASLPIEGDPGPAVWRRVAGVEFRAVSTSRRRRPRRGRSLPSRAEEGIGLRAVRHGDHLHLLRADDTDPVVCPDAPLYPMEAGGGPSGSLRVEEHAGHLHLRGPEEADADGCPLEEGGAALDLADLAGRLQPGTQVLVRRGHMHLVDPANGGTVVCPHCLMEEPPDPGPAAATSLVPEAPRFAPGPPRPQDADVHTRLRSLKRLEAAIAGAKAYRKAWDKYEEAFEAYRKKLAAWRKKQRSGKDAEGSGGKEAAKDKKKSAEKKAGARRRRIRIPPEVRKLPPQERIKWVRRMMAARRARAAGRAAEDEDGRPKPPKKPSPNPGHEAMLKVLDREAPLRLEAHWAQDIEAALDVAAEHDLALVVVGASEAWKLTDRLKASGAMVVLGAPFELGWQDLDKVQHRPDLAARLAAAGIPLAFMSAGTEGMGPDSLPLVAALWIAQGLPEDEALRALTTGAARVLGLAGEVGTVEPGRRCLLQVLSGPPLHPSTRVEKMIIGNQVITLEGAPGAQ